MITGADYPIIIFLLAGVVLSVRFKKLTLSAAIMGAACGGLVYKGTGYTGIATMTMFFIAGTLATGWKLTEKQQLKVAERDRGQRKVGQVLANAGVAAVAGAIACLFPQYANLCTLLVAASFAAATGDTLSSELGTVYGKRFYNILTFSTDTRGLDGVISLEGTIIGVAGSALISLIYAVCLKWDWDILIIILAGTAGNFADSLLGATLEKSGILKNNAVNLLNTLTGALVALLLAML
ncbi:DUF92 domain-containing protein [Mucilaginibacter sp. PAMB04168]|uniref:DUF92 domain-containing protein n=1 Tax=Mucilaginibacter sp. PAMB04168 TaxID=3138567 RepID=UPI0031F69099